MTTVKAQPATSEWNEHPAAVAPARPTSTSSALWRPLGLDSASVDGGFWADRQRANVAAIPAGRGRLEEAGNLQNLRIAAGMVEGEAIGPIFADSDIYKWLEAVAWEHRRSPDSVLLAMQREVTDLVAAAQADDGYLDSVIQTRHQAEGRYFDLPLSHEHYCAGHLIQAAVAQVRCTGDRGLLQVATRVADHLAATFGERKRHDVDGHPVIEMALVELYRETRNREHLELARYFVEARGRGLLESYHQHPTYFSDRVPVREATTVEGHAVRAVYLAAGATDVAVELDDAELLSALEQQFAHMWATKTYLTGGLGARWEGEAFGDEFELPSDRAYAETCAAIGGIQWAWRLLLATGAARYGDAIERMLFNGFLAGVSLTGTEYFYVNTLQLRNGAHPDEPRSPASGRHGWFSCACCPPNVMRTLSSLAGYLASADDSGLQVHQFATATLASPRLAVQVETDYPWDGRIAMTVSDATSEPASLRVRVPGWADGATLTVAGATRSVAAGAYAAVERIWSTGDTVVLDLPMTVRVSAADPRVDAARGQVALERGPLVYAFEQHDQAAAVRLDDAHLVLGGALDAEHDPTLLGGVTAVRATGRTRTQAATEPWPYDPGSVRLDDREVELIAVPYYAWANRGVGAMRVWLPTAD